MTIALGFIIVAQWMAIAALGVRLNAITGYKRRLGAYIVELEQHLLAARVRDRYR